MGKRSDFERKPRDFYPTPMEAVYPLLDHLDEKCYFAEPCAGDRRLSDHLEKFGHVSMWRSDIEPKAAGIAEIDVFDLQDTKGADVFITNPPWDRKILHPLINHLSNMAPTWLLFDADWMHTKQSQPYMSMCEKIVSVGRIKWFGNTTGKDNCVWYLFDRTNEKPTEFHGRKNPLKSIT